MMFSADVVVLVVVDGVVVMVNELLFTASPSGLDAAATVVTKTSICRYP